MSQQTENIELEPVAAALALTEAQQQAVRDAVAEALGDAYDCTRVWSAWGYGTMSADDFSLVAEDDSRVTEIADAAIAAFRAAPPAQPTPEKAAPELLVGEQDQRAAAEAVREHPDLKAALDEEQAMAAAVIAIDTLVRRHRDAAPPAPVSRALSEQEARFTIDGAIAFGRMGTHEPPAGHWLTEYWSIGQQLAKLGETSAWDNQTPVSRADGWQLAPVEPTHRMLIAARRPGSHAERYRAMLAAAPQFTPLINADCGGMNPIVMQIAPLHNASTYEPVICELPQSEETECSECHGKGSVDVTHEPLRDGYTETCGECCDHCQGTGRVAAPSALTLDRDAVFAEMYKRDPYWDTQGRSSAAAVRLALECAATLAQPSASPDERAAFERICYYEEGAIAGCIALERDDDGDYTDLDTDDAWEVWQRACAWKDSATHSAPLTNEGGSEPVACNYRGGCACAEGACEVRNEGGKGEGVAYCASCDGAGTVGTGISDWSATLCNACDGTGYAAPIEQPRVPGMTTANMLEIACRHGKDPSKPYAHFSSIGLVEFAAEIYRAGLSASSVAPSPSAAPVAQGLTREASAWYDRDTERITLLSTGEAPPAGDTVVPLYEALQAASMTEKQIERLRIEACDIGTLQKDAAFHFARAILAHRSGT